MVVYVETPAEITQEERDRVWQTLRLAERLGAETVTLSGQRPSEEILKYARRRNVSKIVVGKPLHARWRDVLFGSVRDALVRGSGGIDVYVISGEEGGGWPAAEKRSRPERDVRGYVTALLVTGLTLGFCISVRSYFQPTNLAMLMLLGVVGISSRSTRGPAIVASVLSVAGFDFFLVPPYYTFAITDAEYLLTFAVMLTTALVVSTLTVRLRRQAEAARTREERTAALYAMSRDLAAAPDLDAVLKAAAQHIHSVFLSQVLLLLPDETGRLAERAAEVVTYLFDVREQAVSQWVFDHGRMAGKTTDTLPAAKGLYIPLRTSQGIVGVLGVHPADPQRLVAPEQLHLLEAFANQIALAIE